MNGGLAIMDYKILAIDFDGTISLGDWPEVGPANDRLISYLLDRKRVLFRKGWTVSRRRIGRIMARRGLVSAYTCKKYRVHSSKSN